MSKELEKALELLRETQKQCIDGMKGSALRAFGALRCVNQAIDSFLSSQQAEQNPEQAEGAQGEREVKPCE